MKISKKSDVRGKRSAGPKQKFHGQTYLWQKASGEWRQLGVIATPEGQYYAGFYEPVTVRGKQWLLPTRLNSALLPVITDPDELQLCLDDYAEQRGLEPTP